MEILFYPILWSSARPNKSSLTAGGGGATGPTVRRRSLSCLPMEAMERTRVHPDATFRRTESDTNVRVAILRNSSTGT